MSKGTNVPLDCFSLLEGTLQQSKGTLKLSPSNNGYISIKLGEKNKSLGWANYKYFILEMYVDIDAQALVEVYFEKTVSKPNEKPAYILYEMVPKRHVKLVIDFDDLSSKKFFLLTLPGMLKGRIHCEPTSIEEMSSITVRFRPGYSHVFSGVTLASAQLYNILPGLTVSGAPMVDPFGQWTEKTWAGKVYDEKTLVTYLQNEYDMAIKQGAQYPVGWSAFGGWKELKFDATGYFHTTHDGRRWWLVDPEGYAFFSNGMCYGTRMGVHGFVDCMENLFSWLPSSDDFTYQDAWTTADKIAEFKKRNGTELGKNRKMFNFARANMIRAFGAKNWWNAWVTINGSRLKKWGFNTLGVGVNNYEDEKVMEFLDKVKIPFVWTLKDFPITDELIFRDFPDVFSEEYKIKSEKFAQQLKPFIGNPYMIGYFITNEPEWRFQTSVNLAERVFAHQKPLVSKDALIHILREKYKSIDCLNDAWNTDFESFESLYQPFVGADQFSEASREDMYQLREVLLQKYGEVPHNALRTVDPDHLDLGLRYNKISENEIAGSNTFEVLSFNCYYPSPTDSLKIAEEHINMPTMIGEWHIGGGDGGLLSCGLLAAATQSERAKACKLYMQTAMSSPSCVGLHYFEMNDQPLLGRFDGECMQHGVIDICNRPYPEMSQMFEAVATDMYERVLNLSPVEKDFANVYRAR